MPTIFPWVARAQGVPETLFETPASLSDKLLLHDQIWDLVCRVCSSLGKPGMVHAEVYSRATEWVWSCMRRASRAAWAERDGARLPIDFWHLNSLRMLCGMQEPPKIRPARHRAVDARLHQLWVALRNRDEVTTTEVVHVLAQEGDLSPNVASLLTAPRVVASLNCLPRSVLLLAANELVADSTVQAEPGLSLPDFNAFAALMQQGITRAISAMAC